MAAKVNAKIELQYGDKAITDDQLISKAKKAYGGKDIKSLDIYVKPEESKAYYVVNGAVTGSLELLFFLKLQKADWEPIPVRFFLHIHRSFAFSMTSLHSVL